MGEEGGGVRGGHAKSRGRVVGAEEWARGRGGGGVYKLRREGRLRGSCTCSNKMKRLYRVGGRAGVSGGGGDPGVPARGREKGRGIGFS